ncbi:N-6 DNA methylase [Aminobacter sp. Piv2-1]|uniref:N-6 DNA methylase n=1 Tax=Aminobacter sp. Piv2-1 TaxID=3031122 RepID=UPI003094867F
MNTLNILQTELGNLGYSAEAMIRDYTFADVLSPNGEARRVALAVFTQVPESYRYAAFGVVSDEGRLHEHRALGAPILFSIGHDDIGVWRVGVAGAPQLIERVSLDDIPALFERYAERWQPLAVHRAKSLGHNQGGYQYDFVDLGLLQAIEHEVETKLDVLLRDVVGDLMAGRDAEESVFRTTFRLLAAKILLDREHPIATGWHDASVEAVLYGIENYYGLSRFARGRDEVLVPVEAAKAWQKLKVAINFRNISSDSLAFIYENTLVTTDTRKRFGTHSTPWQLAEYVVNRLDLSRFDMRDLTIVEPFSGAGVFLVAALRHLRDLLPQEFTAAERHALLVQRIRGAEIDSFACEVATLSLILADYPNANGWKIANADLFEHEVLDTHLASATIVFCNPPWEDFGLEERTRYDHLAGSSISKPMAVLRAAIAARPQGLGFVLPRGFLRQQQYGALRQALAEQYQRIELTALPDRIFQRAGLEASVLIASELRPANAYPSANPSSDTDGQDAPGSAVALVSSVVADRDRLSFLANGKLTSERRGVRAVTAGDLWIGELDELWELVARMPRLGAMADIYKGLKWRKKDRGVSAEPRAGFALGVVRPSRSLHQFGLDQFEFLNMDPKEADRPAPLSRAWDRPKVISNVTRLSRGPWRLAASADDAGLVVSQAFVGIWPKMTELPLGVIEAVLNGPLANAFLTEHASDQHITKELLEAIPMPRGDFSRIVAAVKKYRDARSELQGRIHTSEGRTQLLNSLLIGIDAEVLKAYDLPPRIERQLLEFFRGCSGRRVDHNFVEWIPEDFTAYLPLHEYIGPMVKENRGSWALDVFTPAPDDEVELLRQYVH